MTTHKPKRARISDERNFGVIDLLENATIIESKFEKNSDKVTQALEKCRRNGSGPLHCHQYEAVLRTKALLLQDEAKRFETGDNGKHEPVLIVAPTGSGKSGIIVLLPYVIKSRKVLILTPSKVISEQLGIAFGSVRARKCFFETVGLVNNNATNEALQTLLEPVRIIRNSEDVKDRLGNLVIVNAQKFGGRSKLSLVYKKEEMIKDVREFFQQFDTLIVDEAHHYPAETWLRIVEEFCKPASGLVKKTIFLTATPYRNINGSEGFILGTGEEARRRIAYTIDSGSVVGKSTRPCKFKEPSHGPTHLYQDLRKILDGTKEKRFTPQAMILMRTKTEADSLVEELNMKSRTKHFAVAVFSDRDRVDALEQFNKGKYQVAVTCGVALEGYDNPNVIACVIHRKIVNGRILFKQFVGRCMRLRRGLEGNVGDQSVGTVLSYPEFAQKRLWKERDQLAVRHPLEVDESDTDDDDDE